MNHVGFIIVQAVLRYISGRSARPALMVVSGGSAGAIASPVVASELAVMLPTAEIRQIGDGIAGIRAMRARAIMAG